MSNYPSELESYYLNKDLLDQDQYDSLPMTSSPMFDQLKIENSGHYHVNKSVDDIVEFEESPQGDSLYRSSIDLLPDPIQQFGAPNIPKPKHTRPKKVKPNRKIGEMNNQIDAAGNFRLPGE